MKRFPVTIHMVVHNEENFIWYALESVLPYVTNAIIYDTGSTDRTKELINDCIQRHPECDITLHTYNLSMPHPLRQFRQEQVHQTKTPWLLLVDGDEIWPKSQLLSLLELTSSLPKEKIAVVNQTYNCVGDIWHRLPESMGNYTFAGVSGHINIRLMRTLAYDIKGLGLDEEYYWQGKSVNQMTQELAFSQSYLLHATHLKRSPTQTFLKVGRRKRVFAVGEVISDKELPEVFFEPKPHFVPNVLIKRSPGFVVGAYIVDAFRQIKNNRKYV